MTTSFFCRRTEDAPVPFLPLLAVCLGDTVLFTLGAAISVSFLVFGLPYLNTRKCQLQQLNDFLRLFKNQSSSINGKHFKSFTLRFSAYKFNGNWKIWFIFFSSYRLKDEKILDSVVQFLRQ